jgi:hypothetical protein
LFVVHLLTNLQVCCSCGLLSLLLLLQSSSSAAPAAIQLCCCCRRHLSLLPSAFAILEGTPWVFHHQQDVHLDQYKHLKDLLRHKEDVIFEQA